MMNEAKLGILEKAGGADVQGLVAEVRRLRNRIAVLDRDGGQTDEKHLCLSEALERALADVKRGLATIETERARWGAAERTLAAIESWAERRPIPNRTPETEPLPTWFQDDMRQRLKQEREIADVALTDERAAKNSWYMRASELERQLAMAADALGRVCVVATLRPEESLPGLAACEHAAVAALLSVMRERDAALRDLDVTRRERDEIMRTLAAERVSAGRAVR